MQNKTKTVALFAIVAATLAFVAVAPGLINSASAKITPAQPPSCTNGGGNEPGGQQPNCNPSAGGGLTQNPGTCAQNPQNKCPPGQQ
jgi:hypothetical protein